MLTLNKQQHSTPMRKAHKMHICLLNCVQAPHQTFPWENSIFIHFKTDSPSPNLDHSSNTALSQANHHVTTATHNRAVRGVRYLHPAGMAQLPVVPLSPGEDLAVHSQGHGMTATCRASRREVHKPSKTQHVAYSQFPVLTTWTQCLPSFP